MGQPEPHRRLGPSPLAAWQHSQQPLSSGVFGGYVGIGGDRSLAAVRFGAGESTAGEYSDIHNSDAIILAVRNQVIKICRGPISAHTSSSRRIEQVVVYLGRFDTATGYQSLALSHITQSSETDVVEQALRLQFVQAITHATRP